MAELESQKTVEKLIPVISITLRGFIGYRGGRVEGVLVRHRGPVRKEKIFSLFSHTSRAESV